MSEYERGEQFGREEYKQYRSFKRLPNGDIIGYTHSGSAHIVQRGSEMRARYNKPEHQFYKGNRDYLKEQLRTKHTRERKVRQGGLFSRYGF